jgi:hypothetical protein
MDDTAAYRQTLARMEGDLAKTEATAAKLRAAIAAIRDILGVEYSLPKASERPPLVVSDQRVPPRLTMKELAIWSLQRRSPLRIREMYDLLVGHGYQPPAKYETFRGSMAPVLNRSIAFRKVGTGVFELDPAAVPDNGKTQGAESTLGLSL